MNVVFLGPPGSGKGTQAKYLKSHHGYKHIATGDLLREAAKKEDALGQSIRALIDHGQFVPDAHVSELVFQEITTCWDQKTLQRFGVILDGYPRSIIQAQALDQFFQRNASQLDVVLFFDLDQTVLLKRLSGRQTCSQCGASYHQWASPAKNAGFCDRCQGSLVIRADDAESVVSKRLKIYEEQTAPLIQYYEQQSKLKKLDADQDVEAVYHQIEKILIQSGS